MPYHRGMESTINVEDLKVADFHEVTFHSRLSREQWNEAIKSSVSGDSLDVTASKCDVTHRTAFNMRHKIMSFLEKDEDSIKVAEEVELDEKYVQESHKGKKIEAYLWTDNHSSYNKLTETLGSKRVILSSHEEYDKVNHLNTVNSFHSYIEKWYVRMRGVATKYINRYAALFNVRWLCRGMDGSESLFRAKRRIKSLGSFAFLDWDEVDNTRLYAGRGFECA